MRLKNLLTFLVLLSVSLGMRAADISGVVSGVTGGTGTNPKTQTMIVSTPGALAEWVAKLTGDKYDTNNPYHGFGGSDDFEVLEISGTLNAADLKAINSATCAGFSRFPRIDMSRVTLAEGVTAADVCGINFGPASFDKNGTTISGTGATYIRLPKSMTSAEDVAAMAKMKDGGKNSNLKMVGAYDPDNTDKMDNSTKWAEVAIYSFEANNVPQFIRDMNIPTTGTVGQGGFIEPHKICMSGEFGDNDLVDHNNNNSPNFGYNSSAEWDFTGAHFSDMTIPQGSTTYYNYDDPFCDGQLVAPTTSSNSFYYFSQYATQVVNIKLPDTNMTNLPYQCLVDLASANKRGYQALYGLSDTEFNEQFGAATTVKKYYDEEDNEFTGEKYQENGEWKGKVIETCETDLSGVTPTEEFTYTNTWAGNKSFPVGDLSVIDGKVTPASFDIELTLQGWFYSETNQQCWTNDPQEDENGYYVIEWDNNAHIPVYSYNGGWYYDEDHTQQYYPGNQPTEDGQGGYYLLGGNVKKYIYRKYTYVDKRDNQTKEYTGSISSINGKDYGVFDNTEAAVSFDVLTTYTYEFTDCFDRQQTVTSTGQPLTTYHAEKVNIIDLVEREVVEYGTAAFAPIETLVIPDCYTDLEQECGKWARIRHLVIGSGTKRIHGGAFLKCDYLEDLDFKSGLSDCYIGDAAFNESKSMKHIQLSEGVVSLGNKCFNNSQNLESIRLPETLVNIGNECFKDGHALSSITIPGNVEKIGKQAFALTALKDIYLTTTDPAKVPLIYTGGELFKDTDCTFSANEMYGNNSCPDQDPGLSSKTWDDAVDWYYSHCNLIGVLHYPTELANKVRADLAQLYDWRCEVSNNGGFGLPSQHDATNIRGHLEGTMDSNNGNKGLYSSDGWAQFALMKEYVPNQDIVYSRKYDDVWYTMCFPFDLTDEQLASAFNETFNIVDFSAVELRKDEATGKKELVLHFNNVAETTYKDEYGTEYVRKRTNGLTGDVVREKSGDFDYNVYYKVVNGTADTNVEYHHVVVGTNSKYKTKTFAAGGDATGNIVLIDGYLASAGHPYMIHPSTGAASGSPKVRCYFSGIEWKNVDENGGYDKLYSDNARTVDLGEEKTTDNFNQVAYNGYGGQTYTFKGNWRELKAGAPDIETVEQPVLADYLIEPKEPKAPTTVNPPSTVVDDPGVSLSSQDIRIYVVLMKYIWPGETNISCTYQDGSALASAYDNNESQFNKYFGMAWADYHNADFFNRCKTIYNNYQADAAYKKYLREKEAYDNYLEDLAAYDKESQFVEGWTEAKGREAYNAALTKYNQYLEAVKNYFVLIPQNAYFLARKKNADGTYAELPKYYRETALETGRTTGRWTQYSAIIQPNADALAGIEMGVGPDIQQGVKGYNIAFNEDFEGEFEANEIKNIIADAEEKGQKVEYMNIVYSINGEVVGRGSHSLSNLPQGMYIINGKKYLVK